MDSPLWYLKPTDGKGYCISQREEDSAFCRSSEIKAALLFPFPFMGSIQGRKRSVPYKRSSRFQQLTDNVA